MRKLLALFLLFLAVCRWLFFAPAFDDRELTQEEYEYPLKRLRVTNRADAVDLREL